MVLAVGNLVSGTTAFALRILPYVHVCSEDYIWFRKNKCAALIQDIFVFIFEKAQLFSAP